MARGAMLETLIPVEKYLSTVYRPDVDYVDGRIEERNVGEKDHSKLQYRVARLIERIGVLTPFIEMRIRVSADKYRVPDICAYENEPDEQVFTVPPCLCVEILSPEDRLSRITRRAEDFLSMGVPVVWVLDPLEKRAYVVDRQFGFRETSTTVGTGDPRVVLTLADIFSLEKLS